MLFGRSDSQAIEHHFFISVVRYRHGLSSVSGSAEGFAGLLPTNSPHLESPTMKRLAPRRASPLFRVPFGRSATTVEYLPSYSDLPVSVGAPTNDFSISDQQRFITCVN